VRKFDRAVIAQFTAQSNLLYSCAIVQTCLIAGLFDLVANN